MCGAPSTDSQSDAHQTNVRHYAIEIAGEWELPADVELDRIPDNHLRVVDVKVRVNSDCVPSYARGQDVEDRRHLVSVEGDAILDGEHGRRDVAKVVADSVYDLIAREPGYAGTQSTAGLDGAARTASASDAGPGARCSASARRT
jgi:hypothetical protein